MTVPMFLINFVLSLVGLFLIVGSAYVLKLLPRLSLGAQAISALAIGISGVVLVGFSISVRWDQNDDMIAYFLLLVSLGVAVGLPTWAKGALLSLGYTESRMPSE